MALTKYNYNSFDVTTAASKSLGFNASANGFATIDPGAMTLIKTLTASSSATLSFVDGTSDVVLDNTYPIYVFKFINIHPATDNVKLAIQGNAAGGSGFNETITTTAIKSEHYENDASAGVSYDTTNDQAQGTGYAPLMTGNGLGNANDESGSGYLLLFNPSSTTFVKHFVCRISHVGYQDIMMDNYVAGYFNTTSAIDEISFKFNSGNIDAGTIKLYGIKDS
tara:strand:- start:34 stop:702 length:669 start_codon:yes stop_codon:yes gene_type:complete